MPDTRSAGPAGLAADHLWGFLVALREAGLRTAPAKRADLLRVIAESPPSGMAALYWSARIILLQDVADLPAFDRVFDAWFRGARTDPPVLRDDGTPSLGGPGEEEPPEHEARPGDGTEASALRTYGTRDLGRTRERTLMRALEAAWPAALPVTPSRRRRPSRSGDRLDVRHAWRRAHRHDGEIIDLRRLARPRRPRRLLILADVSGSLRQHTPDLLRVAHTALRAAPARTEVFTFGTRLTRITAALSHPHADQALRSVSELVTDADGGTAIGASLHRFLADPRFAALARGALVIVLSDGLERGDPGPMVRATARLSRLGHRLVWWSPLACSPTYRPATRAMSAQLPSLDHLGGVRDLATALAEVRRLPAVLSGRRRAAARHWPATPPGAPR
ncbi:VWA domain-containing protein [Nonomuraea longispora]|uniref:VWA domain-containing protein n=1 Tax=Nonomuraea longispora TaxID=1848320 RepID=A0A4R4NEW1_9ACTN|nr:VWA domain-containing protein [Nonomuraea longispora]TDC05777.1 VWA domain-containing protein [Nonomuraea longispora]